MYSPKIEGSDCKYPNITVQLSGENGNVFSIIARVMRAMREAGVPAEEIQAFVKEAKSGDYDYVLQTVMRWVNCE